MDRIAAARQRLLVNRSVAEAARQAGPPCSECRYKTLLGMCGSPAYAEPRFDPAKGSYSEDFSVLVTKARAEDGLCGPEAVLFEPLQIPAVAARTIIHGSWHLFRLAVLGSAALVFLLWVLR